MRANKYWEGDKLTFQLQLDKVKYKMDKIFTYVSDVPENRFDPNEHIAKQMFEDIMEHEFTKHIFGELKSKFGV